MRNLAHSLIEAQPRGIGEMKVLIATLEESPMPDGAGDISPYRDKGRAPPKRK